MALDNKNWIRDVDAEHQPWQAGYTPAELIDSNASGACSATGACSFGQLADLFNTNSTGFWPVAVRPDSIAPAQLMHNEISAGWETVNILMVDIDELLDTEQVITTAEKIEIIRDAFGISVSQLAKILRTSRPTIYTWLEGEEPREQSLRRVEQIHEFARQWLDMNPYHFAPGPILRQTLGDLPPLLEQLEQDQLIPEEIEKGLDLILELMQRKYQRMASVRQRTGDSQLSEVDKENHRHALTSTIEASD